MIINRSRCNACSACLDVCPNDALELAGKRITVDDLLHEVEKDEPFYRRSGGGVTVGGGEPTLQHQFVGAFLKRCREHYIHTALESCMHVDPRILESILPHLDLLMCDIKHMNDATHQNLTGVSNRLILENIRLAASRCNTIIRIPTVPGCNDSEDNIRATAQFAASLGSGVESIELLPYHQFGLHLYEQTDRPYLPAAGGSSNRSAHAAFEKCRTVLWNSHNGQVIHSGSYLRHSENAALFFV